MNNQLLETKINSSSLRKINGGILGGVIISIIALVMGGLMYIQDPYIEKVLSYQGNIERGEAIFQVNCAVCHGINGNGNVGPSLINVSKRKSNSRIITQVISGNTPPMPKFQPSAEDMADLLLYLQQLK